MQAFSGGSRWEKSSGDEDSEKEEVQVVGRATSAAAGYGTDSGSGGGGSGSASVPLHSNIALVAPFLQLVDLLLAAVPLHANVSLTKRRKSQAKAATAAGKKFSSRGAVSKRTPKKEVQVSVLDRIKKYPNETLYHTSRTGTLECRACFGKEIKNFRYRVDAHINGNKHKERVASTLATDDEDENLLRACLKRSEEQGGTYGDSLSEKGKLTQIKAVKGCLAAGVPLNALGNPVFETFLAHVNVNLPSSGHLAEHIPFILEEELCTPELYTFRGKMHTLLSHSDGAKALFKVKVGVRAPSTPGHRWGSRFDRGCIIAMNWPGVLKFIAAYESADTEKGKAAKFMRDELVLALMVDVGRSVTSATIVLEGDEPLAHKTYHIVERFRSKFELADDGVFSEDISLPTVAALLDKLVGQGDDLDDLDTLRQYAHDRIGRHSQAREAKTLEMFKAAKLTDFVSMESRKYSDDTIRSLKVLPFVNSKMVKGLLKEKEGYYMAASNNTDIEYGHMAFWKDKKKRLPTWHALVLDVALSPPSSAYMERVFSILRCCFNERQQHVYSDRICASALLKFNRGRAHSSSSAEKTGSAEDANSGDGGSDQSDDCDDESD
ncbi:unnamed protein product [Ectocarpus sp. CCAP 1310/34]|nr:unnamed protein product [Ectocarpus sp. CCAP 1310/34]